MERRPVSGIVVTRRVACPPAPQPLTHPAKDPGPPRLQGLLFVGKLIIANSSPRSHLRSAFRRQIRRNLRMRHCSNLKTSNVKDLSLAAPEARINVVYRRKARLYRAPHPSYGYA